MSRQLHLQHPVVLLSGIILSGLYLLWLFALLWLAVALVDVDNEVSGSDLASDLGEYLTMIGRSREKYRDLSAASRSIISRSRRLRQITDLRDHDRSRYFAIFELNNCFIILSPSLFWYLNHSLTAQGSVLPFFTRERGYNYAWAEYYLQQNTFLR